MPVDEVDVRLEPDGSSTLVATLAYGDYAAVVASGGKVTERKGQCCQRLGCGIHDGI